MRSRPNHCIVHASIEIAGSFIAIIAAIACLIYYFGLKNRYFLIVGLGFFVCGSEDFIHGVLSFGRLFEASGVDLSRFVPGTYVAGRIMLAIAIIVAILLERNLTPPNKITREAITYSVIAVVLGGGVTALAFSLPLPEFTYPENVISRPVDFASAGLFLAAFLLAIKRFVRVRDIFSGMLLACILLNLGGQIYMSFSRQLFDVFFDVAHWANITPTKTVHKPARNQTKPRKQIGLTALPLSPDIIVSSIRCCTRRTVWPAWCSSVINANNFAFRS